MRYGVDIDGWDALNLDDYEFDEAYRPPEWHWEYGHEMFYRSKRSFWWWLVGGVAFGVVSNVAILLGVSPFDWPFIGVFFSVVCVARSAMLQLDMERA